MKEFYYNAAEAVKIIIESAALASNKRTNLKLDWMGSKLRFWTFRKNLNLCLEADTCDVFQSQ
jgi:hypothetical protein